MQRTVLLALTLGLLTASPALAGDFFVTDTPVVEQEKTEVQQGLGVLAPLGCSLGAVQTPLSDGVSVTASLTTATGANCEFVFTPPLTHNGAKFTMAPATSDFDLYVRKGALPTTTLYDCRPFSGGVTTETCLAATDDATPLYVMVRRFSGSGDFTVTAASTTLSPACPAGNNPLEVGGSAAHSTAVAIGAACYFQLTPGASDDLVRFTVNSEGAAYGLYVKRGAVPTTSSADCIASPSFLTRVCDVVADGQDLFVMVRRSSSSGFGQFTLDSAGITLPTLTLGQPVQAQVANFAYNYYKVVVPAGSKFVGIALGSTSPTYACNGLRLTAGEPVCQPETGPYTNADLYVAHVSKGRLPTTLSSSYDCRSTAVGSNDACVFSTEATAALTQAGVSREINPDPATFGARGPVNVANYLGDGKYFVGVRGSSSPSAPADFVLTAVYG